MNEETLEGAQRAVFLRKPLKLERERLLELVAACCE
jgi:hypothetical protein